MIISIPIVFLFCSLFLTASDLAIGEKKLAPPEIKSYMIETPWINILFPQQPQKSGFMWKYGALNQVCTGVNIHFVTGHENDLDMIANCGFKFIRMDFVWQNIEVTKGNYNWSGYDELMANLEKRGIHAIFILDYSNSLYEKPVSSKDPLTGVEQTGIASPQHPESIAAFVSWATAAAIRFKSFNVIWEIWNEPNITFWKPEPDVLQYNTLALAVCKAIKATVPDATIIGPATSQIPFPFIESFVASGILEYLDAVSVHPYRSYDRSPETAAEEFKHLRDLIKHYAPEGKKDMPVISSEWGYSSANKGLTPEKQAEFLIRMQLSNLLNEIPVSIWYDWKNDGNNPSDFEHNCGTVTSDLRPKPAYNAIQTMNIQLKGYTLLLRIDIKNDNDYVLLFGNPSGNFKIVAWTLDAEHPVLLDKNLPEGTSATVIDGYGKSLKPKTESGRLVLELSGLPEYITLPGGTILD